FKNGANAVAKPEEREFSAVGLDALHGVNQHREAGAVYVTDLREVHEDTRRSLLDQALECLAHGRRFVQINFPFERDKVGGGMRDSGHAVGLDYHGTLFVSTIVAGRLRIAASRGSF